MSAPNRPPRGATLVVTLYESLPDVLARVRNEAGHAVRLEIPTGSPLFLTAVEFRALREVARDRRIELSLVTDDSLRRQLASVFNLPVEGPGARPSEHRPHMGGPPAVNATTRTIAGAPPRTAPGAPPPVPPGERPVRVRNPLPPLPGDEPASREDGVRPAQPGRWPGRPRGDTDPAITTSPPTDGTPRRLAETGRVGDQAEPTDVVARSRESGRLAISPRSVALAIGALALTGVVLLAVGYFLLSSATVTITPVTRPASADLEYAIVPPDTDPPANVLVVPGERVSLDFSVEASQATTGTRAEPAGEARGRVRFSNPNDEDIDIAAGTSLETEAGQAYAVDEDLTIPAGDPGLGRYGSAEASVTAEDPGTGGNIEIGGLSGRLENGVYFSNRDAPLADGTDREVPVVGAGDVQALRETATVALREKITAEVDQSTPDGVTIVPESIAEDDLTFSFSGQAGDEAETLSVTASAPVTVLTYRPAETETAILADATTRLTAGAPAGFQFDPASLQLAAPVLVEADGSGARYTVTGSGRWVALISDADRDRLADQLAGSDAGEADRILSSVPSIEGSEVDYGPGWLPDRMPPSAGRISIAVDD